MLLTFSYLNSIPSISYVFYLDLNKINLFYMLTDKILGVLSRSSINFSFSVVRPIGHGG